MCHSHCVQIIKGAVLTLKVCPGIHDGIQVITVVKQRSIVTNTNTSYTKGLHVHSIRLGPDRDFFLLATRSLHSAHIW